jgi:hypothetical protein
MNRDDARGWTLASFTIALMVGIIVFDSIYQPKSGSTNVERYEPIPQRSVSGFCNGCLRRNTATTNKRLGFWAFDVYGQPARNAVDVHCEESLDGKAFVPLSEWPTGRQSSKGSWWSFDLTQAETRGGLAAIECVGKEMAPQYLSVEFVE